MHHFKKQFRINAVSHYTVCGVSAFLLGQMTPVSAWAESDTIVVTATRTAIDLNDAPSSISVITAADLELTASVDLLDAVRQTPGISFQGRGFGGRQTLSIRGMGRDQTLFMIDGRRILGTDSIFTHSNFQYDWVPVNSIERVEVVRGPLSALYGSEALGGVVNIVTKPIPEAWAGSLAARYTLAEREGDEQFISLSAAGPLSEKAGVLLSYTFNDAEEIPFEANPSLSELEGKQSHNLYGKVTVQPTPAHRIDFDFMLGREDRYRNTQDRGRPPVFESSFDLDRLQIGAGYSGEFGKNSVQINVSHAELERINTRTHGIASSVPQNFTNDVLDAFAIFPVSTSHRLVVGGEVRRETLEHSSIASGKGSLDFTGVFLQDEWRLSDALHLTVGGRYDSHENFGSEFSPRAYLVYHPSQNWTFKGGYGHGFRSPTLKQSLQDYLFVGPFSFVGNPDVGPETSDNFELSASYKSGATRVAITGFVNQVDDLISTQCVVNCSARFGRLFTFVNLEQTETKGIETEVEFDLTQSIAFGASHVYMEAINQITGLRLAERPDHVFSAQLTWKTKQPGVSATLRTSYHGNEIEYDTRGNAIDLPGYLLWHAQGAWDVSDHWVASFGVKNLGNLKLAEKSPDFTFAERGRSFYLGMRRDF